MQSRSGFTIVELLVVIVVIGILATVVAVIAVGVQDRARNAKLLSGIDSIEKGLRLYAVKNNRFPEPSDVPNVSSTWATCVQPTAGPWPEKDGLTSNQCFVNGSFQMGYSTVVRDELVTTMGKIPDTSDITTTLSGTASSRGIVYQYLFGPNPGAGYPNGYAYLIYFIKNDQTCGRGIKGVNAGYTQCVVELR